jgi:LAGLIDADG DNA endonuclease family protein
VGKRGPKPKQIINTTWSPRLAYAIGLITTDGCLSKDGRHIDLTSKDREQLENFGRCLGITLRISTKQSGIGTPYLRVQIGSVLFYKFLESIGLTQRKSKTLGAIIIPDAYFFDFLRGHFDGDGTFYSYMDPRWRSSFMFYTVFLSASKRHILWLRTTLKRLLGIRGHITTSQRNSVYQLKYAKKESRLVLGVLYKDAHCICLTRKREKVAKALKVV